MVVSCHPHDVHPPPVMHGRDSSAVSTSGSTTKANPGETQKPTSTKQNRPLALSGSFSPKAFILVPGGGVEPPRGCPRRILSPFFALLQGLALSRENSQIASIHRGFCDYGTLHRIAPNRTKFRFKPAPKPAPELCPFFAIAPTGLPLRLRRFRDKGVVAALSGF
jgi:hypothetical protein